MRPGCSGSPGLDRVADGGAAAVHRAAAPHLPAVSVIHRARRCAVARLLCDAGRPVTCRRDGPAVGVRRRCDTELPGAAGSVRQEGMDFSQVADVISRYAAPGDCLILDNSAAWKPGPVRPLTAAGPPPTRSSATTAAVSRRCSRNRLWDSHIAVWAWADKMPAVPPCGRFRAGQDAARSPTREALRPGTPAGPNDGLSGAQPIWISHRGTLAVQLRASHQVHSVSRADTGHRDHGGPRRITFVPDRRAWADRPACRPPVGYSVRSLVTVLALR